MYNSTYIWHFYQQREYSIVRRSKCISNGEYFFLVEMSGIEPAATIWPCLAFQWNNKFEPGYKPKKAFPMSKRRSEVCRGVYRISVGGGGAGGELPEKSCAPPNRKLMTIFFSFFFLYNVHYCHFMLFLAPRAK